MAEVLAFDGAGFDELLEAFEGDVSDDVPAAVLVGGGDAGGAFGDDDFDFGAWGGGSGEGDGSGLIPGRISRFGHGEAVGDDLSSGALPCEDGLWCEGFSLFAVGA